MNRKRKACFFFSSIVSGAMHELITQNDPIAFSQYERDR
jgi:hypothetical protein